METTRKGAAPAPGSAGGSLLLAMAVAVFFLFGGITNLNDILVPKLKALFQLGYAEAMLVQFAFFTSYALFSIPAGLILARLGYARGVVLGFSIMAASCLLFLPAAYSGVMAAFLAALFMLGGGVTVLQVAVNPLIVALGEPEHAPSRLTFAQFFNSLGVFLMVRFGAVLILGPSGTTDPATLSGAALTAWRIADSAVIGRSYIGLAVVLTLIAIVFWLRRRDLDRQVVEKVEGSSAADLLRRPRLAMGIASLFAYVGAEVSIASIMIIYLGLPRTLALAPQAAGILLSYYWLGALIGRLAGGFLLRLARPGALLTLFAFAAIALLTVSGATAGAVAGWSLILIGGANSLMFPTIFSLSIEGLGKDAAKASGLLCTAIVGGAIVPVLTGLVADRAGLAAALIVPGLCYLWIARFGWFARAAPGA
jgi:FHS family L-fucose permease-like MFS transporter